MLEPLKSEIIQGYMDELDSWYFKNKEILMKKLHEEQLKEGNINFIN